MGASRAKRPKLETKAAVKEASKAVQASSERKRERDSTTDGGKAKLPKPDASGKPLQPAAGDHVQDLG